ncbi:hypothetical protein COL26b_002509 [Colletotrichum chrysophilum]|uniref:Uncharacterized protein n=1 Tax=Colletotrichum chrysophilum TaxID=1836956 RepID=A0AAD9ADL3_9PEZI|nr:uncharacterized protein COL26b_002509 [Colletotrichum chrysophilum]KAJ0379340.1 hypothetical protein COL26b_002509 [Colletotrichum chrysophilum]KAK1845020.1 hypothetical protein CCHR01_12335 [Colletotrichum chrysophilum]
MSCRQSVSTTRCFRGHYLSPNEQDNVRKVLVEAETASGEARRNQSAVTREVDRVLTTGKTLTDLHDAQIQELNDRILEQGVEQSGEGGPLAEVVEEEDEAQGRTP